MWEEWTTAQIALILSGLSLLLALSSFVWNIWSKFIYPKPQLQVRIRFNIAVGEGTNEVPGSIALECINHGPGEIKVQSAIGFVKDGHILSKAKRGLLRAYENWPYSLQQAAFGETPGLPTRLAVGESFVVNFSEKILKGGNLKNLGFQDGFGREHFADRLGRTALRRASKVAS
ncbi:hypothetical protein [Pseudorhodobacter sp.]|uniref:hypothetical protein n=1 Tax=Pseudorhodobacter sp. TaxID=1934400 RepID=UPI00264888B7|nr:hypothetical protein [Pseudorhodobacter sp.]MDN5787381.1 hypothetical protein [Pseudorhodobacter sp.]